MRIPSFLLMPLWVAIDGYGMIAQRGGSRAWAAFSSFGSFGVHFSALGVVDDMTSWQHNAKIGAPPMVFLETKAQILVLNDSSSFLTPPLKPRYSLLT
jgi:hypothetical protein